MYLSIYLSIGRSVVNMTGVISVAILTEHSTHSLALTTLAPCAVAATVLLARSVGDSADRIIH